MKIETLSDELDDAVAAMSEDSQLEVRDDDGNKYEVDTTGWEDDNFVIRLKLIR